MREMLHIASDLEGTLVTYETWMGLRDECRASGRGAAWDRFYRAFIPRYLLSKIGLQNAQAMRALYFDGMTAFLKGYSRAQVHAWAERVAERMWQSRRADVVAELAAHAAKGNKVVIASGSYPEVIRALAARIHPSIEVIGTRIAWDDQNLAVGVIEGPVSYGMVKAARVSEWLGGARLDIAYGDSDADLHMLVLARAPVAVHPADKRIARAAREGGWRIIG